MSLLRRAATVYSRDGFRTLVKEMGVYTRRTFKQGVLDPALFHLWKYNLIDFDRLYDEEYYADMLSEKRMADVREFSNTVYEYYEPQRVIDFGAGAGRFLIPFHQTGVDVCGVERNHKAISISPLPERVFDLHDLTEPYTSDVSYDVALCMEVLEHIPGSAVDITIKSISDACHVAIVTAATPGQGGKHHVNEREIDEWKRLFNSHGMRYRQDHVDRIAEQIDPQFEQWLTNNLMVFISATDSRQ